MNIIKPDDTEILKRKNLRKQLSQTDDETAKDNIRKQIIDNEIDDLNSKIEKKELRKKQLKEEISKDYFFLITQLQKTFKKIGIIKNDSQLNERYNFSRCYFNSARIQNHFPKLATISQIIQDIDSIIANIDYIIDEILNRENVKRILKQIQEKFTDLKMKILTEFYLKE